MTEVGPLLASGRDGDIFEFGTGRVLRRAKSGRVIEGEARTIAYAREHGYPVPEIYEVRAGVLAHDLHIVAANHVENGVSLNGEVAFAPSLALFGGALRPVLGGTVTTSGGTSWGYLDARWCTLQHRAFC